VEARGRPGLLHRISNVLSAQGRNIEALLVDTQGHKAVDVFYITRGGGALDADWEAALDKELRRVLGG
jgi:UTP:GlnB (protein PII) uridylyltransferase